jgi:hypothetical protein
MTVSGVLIAILVLATFFIFLTYLRDYIFIFILITIAPVFVGLLLDQRASIAAEKELLDASGMTQVEYEMLDHRLRWVFEHLKPVAYGPGGFEHGYQSQRNAREVITIRFNVDLGESSATYTACAVQSAREYPKTIIRRRRFKDRFPLYRDAIEHFVGRDHVIESRDSDMIQAIRSIDDWFILAKRNPWKFYTSWPEGQGECFGMYGSWVLYSGIGTAGPESVQHLIAFVSAFCDDLERAVETTSSTEPSNG